MEEPFPSERDFAPALQNAGSLTLAMPTTNEYVELEAEKVPKTEGAGKQMQTIHCYWGKKNDRPYKSKTAQFLFSLVFPVHLTGRI